MGTSKAFEGQKPTTPIVPTWVDDPSENDDDKVKKPIKPAESDRFRKSRGQGTSYLKTKDREYLGNAFKSYVSKTLLGSRNATKRMGASLNTSKKLLESLINIHKNGLQKTLEDLELNFNLLSTQSIDTIFIEIQNKICSPAGNIDEGIASIAMSETIRYIAESDLDTLDNLSIDNIKDIFEKFVTYSIFERVCSDIESKIIIIPDTIEDIFYLEEQIIDFIEGNVQDSLNKNFKDISTLPQDQIDKLVEKVYQNTFDFLTEE